MPARPAIALRLSCNGRPCDSETTYTWAGAHILTIHTTVPDVYLALELHSTFIGHPDVATRSVHLVLGPVGERASIEEGQHDQGQLDPMLTPRACVYEHAHRLVEIFHRHGYDVAVDADGERTFDALEQGISRHS